MDKIPGKIKKQIKEFINNLLPEIQVDKVILFGSYVREGTHKGSDVDVAVFSQKFLDWKTVDILTFLFNKTMNLTIDLQPIGFEDPKADNDFVKTINKQGVVLFENEHFTI